MVCNVIKWRVFVFSDECSMYHPIFVFDTEIEDWENISRERCFGIIPISYNSKEHPDKYNHSISEYLVFPQQKFVFQYHLSPPHIAKCRQKFLQVKNPYVLPFPANSLDMNPIENL